MRNSFLISVLFLLVSCNKNEQPKPDHSGLFIKFFGAAKNDTGYSVKESSDGGYIIVGSTIPSGRQDKDCYIVKVDSDGNKVWDRTFGDTYDGEAMDVKVDRLGNYLVAGYKKNDKDSSDFLLLKYNIDGQLLSTFEYGMKDRNEKAWFVTIASDGGIIVAGSRQQTSSTQMNMFVIKTNMDTILWERDLGLNALYDEIGTMVELEDHSFLWCGSVSRGSEKDLRLTSVSEFGNVRWDLSIGEADGSDQIGKDIHITKDGNFIVAGTETQSEGYSPLLVKVNRYGTVLWESRPGGKGRQVNSVYPVSDGGYVLAGESAGDYLLMYTDGNGVLSWESTYGGKGEDGASKVLETPDGGFIMIGTVFAANNTLLGLIKTNNKGNITK